MTSSPELILYHYVYSPYAHKVSYYLALRKIQFAHCFQPAIMPRPDLSRELGITYRRIPLLAIGNSVYIDAALILEELERRFPDGALGGGEDAERWRKWGDGVFRYAAGCIPPSLPLMKNPAFRKDREDFSGRSFDPEQATKARAIALKGVQAGFDDLEKTLSDGRTWLLNSKDVTLADINALWVTEWMATLPGALEGSNVSSKTYPLTYAWIARFVERRGKLNNKPAIDGKEAKRRILSATPEFTGSTGELYRVTPVDSGKNHPQVGTLIYNDSKRIALRVNPPEESNKTVTTVFPVDGYKLEKASKSKI